MAPLSLAREPLRLTLRAWEVGFATAAEAARIGGDLLDPDPSDQPPVVAEPWPPPAEPESEPAPEPADYENGQPTAADVTEAAEVTDVPPPVPEELVPDHVDQEPVLVAEVAEEGAAEGAGAELHVDAPWEGYDQMTAADIRDRLALATPAEVAAVELYEAAGKNRRSVLDAAGRALRRG